MGEIVWGTDFKAKQSQQSTEAALEQMAVALVAEWVTLGGGIDALIDTAPSEMNPEAS
jgi:hypothetical protein